MFQDALVFCICKFTEVLKQFHFFRRTTEFTIHLQHKGLHITPSSTEDAIGRFHSVVNDMTLAIALQNVWVSCSEFLKDRVVLPSLTDALSAQTESSALSSTLTKWCQHIFD